MFKSLVFWAVFPFVIPQALKVKKNAPRFADAEGDIEGFIGKGKPVKLLGIGDSIISGVGTSHIAKSWMGQTGYYLSKQLKSQIEWTKMSETGAKLEKINLQYMNQIQKERFDIVIISVGVNDVTGLSKISKWKQQLNMMLQTIKTQSPKSIVAVSGIPPMHVFPLLPQPLRYLLGLRARIFDEVIQKVIKPYDKVIHIPIEIEADPKNFSDDGFHPSEFGCQKWGEVTAEMILKELNT